MTIDNDRSMWCPYCKRTFTITEEEQYGDETFECSHCHQINAGCCEADELGTLIGVSILDEQIQGLLREQNKKG